MHVFDLITKRLLLDVIATVGAGRAALVLARAAELRVLGVEAVGTKLVDDVQRLLHDERIDTTWPACPRHGTHPLWYREEGWWCDRDRARVALLGTLGAPEPRGA